MDLMEITCPRCQNTAQVRFYGPCDNCRDELLTKMRSDAGEVSEVEYEPKMNVIPNQIATKE